MSQTNPDVKASMEELEHCTSGKTVLQAATTTKGRAKATFGLELDPMSAVTDSPRRDGAGLPEDGPKMMQSPLARDILPSVESIAVYVYGEASQSTVRKVRHQIERHGLPITKVAGRIESRCSWIDARYAAPTNGAQK